MKTKNSDRGASGCLVLVIVAVAALILIGMCSSPQEPSVEDLAEMILKEHLKDPSSYERVSIRTFDRPGGKGVIIDYRAKNSFGGVVPGGETFFFDASKNRVDVNGNIIEKFKN